MNKVLTVKFGSHLYGTNTPDSDQDFKGIYLPTAREIVLHKYPKTIQVKRAKEEKERNNKDDIDIEYFSLDRYLDLLMQGQTVALDMLFAPDELMTFNPEWINIWRAIKLHQDKLLTKNVTSFMGYARQQAAKYGIKGSRMDSLKRTKKLLDHCLSFGGHQKLSLYSQAFDFLVQECADLISLEKRPLVEIALLKGPAGGMTEPHLGVNGRYIPMHANVKYANDVVTKMLDGYGQRANKAHLAGGVDWKALSHAVRVNTEALELLRSGHITFPRPDKDKLLEVKLGKLSYDQVAEMIEEGLASLYEAQEHSALNDKPDTQWAEDFVDEIYTKIVKESK